MDSLFTDEITAIRVWNKKTVPYNHITDTPISPKLNKYLQELTTRRQNFYALICIIFFPASYLQNYILSQNTHDCTNGTTRPTFHPLYVNSYDSVEGPRLQPPKKLYRFFIQFYFLPGFR